MEETRYYPLIDCDEDGNEKAPMFPAKDRNTVIRTHAMWLEEIVPRYYRLCVKNTATAKAAGASTIRCPKCGKALTLIAAKTARTDNHRLGLYTCSSCRND